MNKSSLAILCAGWMGLCTLAAHADTIILDNRSSSQFALSGTWDTGSSAGYHVTDYRYILTTTVESATATWTPVFPSLGTYEVSVWYTSGANRPVDAKYTVNYNGGSAAVYVNQTSAGGQWVPIGSWEFDATGGSVVLSNESATVGKAVVADAVRFVRSGTVYGDQYQGMWIYAWGAGILSASQTDAMIATARQNNLNIIFPQVRKIGDSYYASATEPFASNIEAGYTDPLADIIAKAHDTSGGKQYIEVHAWIVPYRVWKDSEGALPAGHVLLEHPEWQGQTNTGSVSDGSQYLDPGVPEVTDYLVDVVSEIVQNYDVDGVHFDYYRYAGVGWGYNPTAITRFNALYGKTGQPATNDPDFCDFRRDQIRQMGRKVYAAVKNIRWGVKVSAATIQWGSFSGDFTQSSAYASIFQDWPGFMAEGLLDMNVLMNYKREHDVGQAADYRDWADFLASSKAGRLAINGPGVYMNSIHNSVTQILYAMDTPGMDGENPYVYHMTNQDGDSASDFWATVRADCFTTTRSAPAAPWIDTPTQGILRGTVTVEGVAADGMTVTLSGGPTGTIKTDGTGFYAFLKSNPGTGFSVTASVPGYTDQTKTFDITAGVVTTVDFNFTTATATPTATPSATATETASPSPTASLTPTATATATAAPSPTATATPPPSPTPSATPAPSPTETATPEPTGSAIHDWNVFLLR